MTCIVVFLDSVLVVFAFRCAELAVKIIQDFQFPAHLS